MMFWNCKIAAHLTAFSALATLVGLHHGPVDGGDHTPAVIRVLDADGNGELSATEIDGASAALRSLDGNRDGRLTHAELLGVPGEMHAAHDRHAMHAMHAPHAAGGEFSREEILAALHFLLQSDSNGDGVLDDPEIWAAARAAAGRPDLPGGDLEPEQIVARIRTHDTDGDGLVQRTELLHQAHDVMSESGAAHPHEAHDASDPAPDAVTRIEHHFLSNDSNGDGRIERQEVPEQGLSLFESGDTNGDGVLDRAEVRALAEHYAQIHAQHEHAPRRKAL